MAPAEEVTLGEVYRLLGDVRGDFKALAAKVEERPDWQDVRRIENNLLEKQGAMETALLEKIANEKATREAALATSSRAIKALEDWNKWALRTTGGAVIVAVAGWVLAGNLVG